MKGHIMDGSILKLDSQACVLEQASPEVVPDPALALLNIVAALPSLCRLWI